MSVLIVVASYNGKEFLPRLLNSLEEHKKEVFEVLVVDTGTTDIESLNYLESIKSEYKVERTPYKRFSSFENCLYTDIVTEQQQTLIKSKDGENGQGSTEGSFFQVCSGNCKGF